MLGIGGRGVQGTGGNRCHVQWQHIGMRQRESSYSSLLNAPARNRFVTPVEALSFRVSKLKPLQHTDLQLSPLSTHFSSVAYWA